jgi:hypothetical protein
MAGRVGLHGLDGRPRGVKVLKWLTFFQRSEDLLWVIGSDSMMTSRCWMTSLILPTFRYSSPLWPGTCQHQHTDRVKGRAHMQLGASDLIKWYNYKLVDHRAGCLLTMIDHLAC